MLQNKIQKIFFFTNSSFYVHNICWLVLSRSDTNQFPVTEPLTSFTDNINRCIDNVIFLHTAALTTRFILGCKRTRPGRTNYSNTHYSGSLLKWSFKVSLSHIGLHWALLVALCPAVQIQQTGDLWNSFPEDVVKAKIITGFKKRTR